MDSWNKEGEGGSPAFETQLQLSLASYGVLITHKKFCVYYDVLTFFILSIFSGWGEDCLSMARPIFGGSTGLSQQYTFEMQTN